MIKKHLGITIDIDATKLLVQTLQIPEMCDVLDLQTNLRDYANKSYLVIKNQELYIFDLKSNDDGEEIPSLACKVNLRKDVHNTITLFGSNCQAFRLKFITPLSFNPSQKKIKELLVLVQTKKAQSDISLFAQELNLKEYKSIHKRFYILYPDNVKVEKKKDAKVKNVPAVRHLLASVSIEPEIWEINIDL